MRQCDNLIFGVLRPTPITIYGILNKSRDGSYTKNAKGCSVFRVPRCTT